jgi:hypothetical protein
VNVEWANAMEGGVGGTFTLDRNVNFVSFGGAVHNTNGLIRDLEQQVDLRVVVKVYSFIHHTFVLLKKNHTTSSHPKDKESIRFARPGILYPTPPSTRSIPHSKAQPSTRQHPHTFSPAHPDPNTDSSSPPPRTPPHASAPLHAPNLPSQAGKRLEGCLSSAPGRGRGLVRR